MKKNILSIILTASIIFGLTGCGSSTINEVVEESTVTDTIETSVENTISENDVLEKESDASHEPEFSFASVDINGNDISSDIIQGAKLVLVNFWEPWCGPCVGEIPDLEKLYETYQDQGFMILGVFSSTDMLDEAHAIIDDSNVTYPIVICDDNLTKFMTNYFPTTILVDGNGKVISSEPIIGAQDYNSWEQIILENLN